MIVTERLIIRPFTLNDLPEFEKLLDNPDGGAWRNEKNNSKGFLSWHISNYVKMDIVNGIVCFGLFEKHSGHILGAIGAGEHDDLHETEIFYNLLPSARGHGYATEAAQAVTHWALNTYQIPYMIGTTGVRNIASQRVLEKCGYRYIDTRTLLVHIEGEKYDFKYYRYTPASEQ